MSLRHPVCSRSALQEYHTKKRHIAKAPYPAKKKLHPRRPKKKNIWPRRPTKKENLKSRCQLENKQGDTYPRQPTRKYAAQAPYKGGCTLPKDAILPRRARSWALVMSHTQMSHVTHVEESRDSQKRVKSHERLQCNSLHVYDPLPPHAAKVAVCCSVLQCVECVAVCCSVTDTLTSNPLPTHAAKVAVCCIVLHCVAG